MRNLIYQTGIDADVDDVEIVDENSLSGPCQSRGNCRKIRAMARLDANDAFDYACNVCDTDYKSCHLDQEE